MKAFAVAGLGFGDEGKGSVVDALAEKYGAGLVVRYNGGAQAAHNVVRDGKHHTFAQFGSATLLGARTHLSRFMVVNPSALFNEALHLDDIGISSPHQLLSVSPEALVTTPYHILANRIREALRGKDAHGTTGMGVGETVVMDDNINLSLRVEDLFNSSVRRRKLDDIRSVYIEKVLSGEFGAAPAAPFLDRKVFEHTLTMYREFEANILLRDDYELDGLMERSKVTIFEGAQGMLLDQNFGFHPYTTWSDCTFDNVLDIVDEFDTELVRLGVLRTYHTRHGAGPLPTEEDAYSRITENDHNTRSANFQGRFRAGPFDMVLARYAVRRVGQLDGLALTHVDHLPGTAFYSSRYWVTNEERGVDSLVELDPEEIAPLLNRVEPRFVNVPSESFANHLAKELGVPLFLTSKGPTAADKEFFL